MGEKTSTAIINFRWACGCLAACLVGTLSFKWAESPQIVNIISVALSLASLILAVIAIIQALLSNDGMLRSLSDINIAATNILSISKDLSTATSIFGTHVDRIGSMPNQLNAINDQVSEIRSRIDSGKSVDSELSPIKDDDTNNQNKTHVPSDMTFGAALSLYMIMLSHRSGTAFRTEDIISEQVIQEYCSGVIAGIRFSQIIDINIDDSNRYSVKSLLTFDDKDIEDIVFRAMKDENAPEKLIDYIKSVDNYFKATPSTPPTA